jgi:hypothetical protein
MPYGEDKKNLFKAAIEYAKDLPGKNEYISGMLYKLKLREKQDAKKTAPNRASKTR